MTFHPLLLYLIKLRPEPVGAPSLAVEEAAEQFLGLLIAVRVAAIEGAAAD